MFSNWLRRTEVLAAATLGGWLAIGAGCTPGGPKLYPVQGRVEAAGGAAVTLTGHTVEIALATNPQVRAAGEIRADGSFVLETLQDGVIRPGVPEGRYDARIVLNDDDSAKRRQAALALPGRYFHFERSGLSITVPAADSVSIHVSKR